MRRLLVLGTLLLLFVAACAPTAGNITRAARPSAAGAATTGASRDAQIYAAVLRRYLTTPQENSNLPFATVFVLDYTDASAADPMRTAPSTTTTPISATDQRTIVAALHDLVPLRFVTSRDQVIIHRQGCSVVRDNGILILLGPATTVAGTTRVSINGFVACLGATWLTYLVTADANGWMVTGTSGPAAVA